MRLYLASDPGGGAALIGAIATTGARRGLASYHEIRTRSYPPSLLAHWQARECFLDSGAFAAHTCGAAIPLGEYIAYCHAHRDRYVVQAGLDVIGDAAASRRNLEAMEASGLAPLPTFHQGSDLGELDRLCERYDYLALGGLVPIARHASALTGWLDRCWRVIRRHWPKRVHAFGITGWDAMARYPWYSVDSSRAFKAAGFGNVVVYDGGLRTVPVARRQATGHEHLADTRGSARSARIVASVRALLAAERDLTALWAKRGVTWND